MLEAFQSFLWGLSLLHLLHSTGSYLFLPSWSSSHYFATDIPIPSTTYCLPSGRLRFLFLSPLRVSSSFVIRWFSKEMALFFLSRIRMHLIQGLNYTGVLCYVQSAQLGLRVVRTTF